eukprot:gene2260-8039_t
MAMISAVICFPSTGVTNVTAVVIVSLSLHLATLATLVVSFSIISVSTFQPLSYSTCVFEACEKTCVPSTVEPWGNCCNNTWTCQYDVVFQDFRCIPPDRLCI